MTADMLLERLDLALADDPSADAEMLALVHDVRDEAPQMTAEFSAKLDDRVRAGFAAAPGTARRRRLRMPNLFVMGPIAAVAAAGVVAVVIGTGGGSPSPDTLARQAEGHVSAGPVAPTAAAKSSADSSAAGVAASPSVTAATPVAPQAQFAAPLGSTSGGTATGRKVERSTQLSLATPTDTLQRVAAGVVRVTQQADGFVGNSQVQISGNHGSAAFTLRIPSRNLENALTALTHLAHVTSMSQSTQDITSEFSRTNTSLARLTSRLAGLRRTQQTRATIALEQRLNRAIAAQQAALSGLRHRADYVTVNLAITGLVRHHVAPVHHNGGHFNPGRALHTAGRIISVGAGVLLIAATILIPLALLLGAFWLAGRSMRRRNREAALKTS
jgi:hypothetical protein